MASEVLCLHTRHRTPEGFPAVALGQCDKTSSISVSANNPHAPPNSPGEWGTPFGCRAEVTELGTLRKLLRAEGSSSGRQEHHSLQHLSD